MTNHTLTLAEAIAAVAASQPRDYIHADGRDSKGDTYRVELEGSDAIRFSVQGEDTMHECGTIPLDARFALYQGAFELAPKEQPRSERLPLAPGSKLVPELNTVTDAIGVKHFVSRDNSGAYIDSNQRGTRIEIHATDARFLLHRSGNLPELDELEKLRVAARLLVNAIRNCSEVHKYQYEPLSEPRPDTWAIVSVDEISPQPATLESILPAEPKEPTNG